MRKISKSTLKAVALGVTALTLTVGLTGCGEKPAGQTINVVSGDFHTQYLRVNDINTVCFTDSTSSGSKSSSSNGVVCDFSEITIPNGVEVIVLDNNSPEQGDWKLNHFVDLKNKTSDCIYLSNKLTACNFLSDAANGSFGTEK